VSTLSTLFVKRPNGAPPTYGVTLSTSLGARPVPRPLRSPRDAALDGDYTRGAPRPGRRMVIIVWSDSSECTS